jgi:hypothetical protein
LVSGHWPRNSVKGIHQLHQKLVSILLALPAEHTPSPKWIRVIAFRDDELATLDVRG